MYSPCEVDRIWLWVYYNEIPIHPEFYLLKGECRVWGLGFIEGPCKQSALKRAQP